MDYEALKRALPDEVRRAPLKAASARTPHSPLAPAPRLEAVKADRGEEPTIAALKAWEARVAGTPIVDVARGLAVSIELAKKLISEVHDAIRDDLKDSLDLNRQLDLARIDGLLAAFYPSARAGNPESANVTLRALQHRAKLTGIEPLPDPGRSHPTNVVLWIQQQLPNINRLVEELPLELPPGPA